MTRFAVSVLIQHGHALTHAPYLWPAADADTAEGEIAARLLARGLTLRGLIVRPL